MIPHQPPAAPKAARESWRAARSEKSSDRSENFSDHGSVVVVDQASTEETTTTNSAATGKNFRSAADAQALRTALTAAKVYGKRRRDLVADDWVTAARFTAWLDYAGSLDALDNPAGFAILRCLDHIEPPPVETEPPATPWPIMSTDGQGHTALMASEDRTVTDRLADAHRRYPPIESRVWTSIRVELASDLKNVAARRICESLYPTRFDDERLQLVVVDPTWLLIARQFQTSIERMVKRDTQRACTVEFVTL